MTILHAFKYDASVGFDVMHTIFIGVVKQTLFNVLDDRNLLVRDQKSIISSEIELNAMRMPPSFGITLRDIVNCRDLKAEELQKIGTFFLYPLFFGKIGNDAIRHIANVQKLCRLLVQTRLDDTAFEELKQVCLAVVKGNEKLLYQ